MFKPGNARALNSNTMESKVPHFNLCHCEHGVPSKPRLGKTRVWASAREVTWGRTGLAHLQQLQVCRLCLGGHQLCQHLRHHPHVPTHHLELTVQLRDLKHTVGPGERSPGSRAMITSEESLVPGAGVGGVEGAPRGADLPVPSRLLSHSPALRGLCWAAPNPRGPLTEVLPTVTISKLGSLVQGMPKAVELRVNAPQSTAGRRQHLPGPRRQLTRPWRAGPFPTLRLLGQQDFYSPLLSCEDGIWSRSGPAPPGLFWCPGLFQG